MKVFVTGSAGFIGYHLVEILLKNDFEVVSIDNMNDYYDVNLKFARIKNLGINQDDLILNKSTVSSKFSNHKFYYGDIANKELIDTIFEEENFDIVVNLAAQAGVRYSITNPDVYISSNIIGFYNILESCRKYPVKNLIYASSSSVYGNNEKTPFSTTDQVDDPISLYAATKKSNELMAHTYSHLYKIPTTGLRFFTVYGPYGRPDMACYLFVDAIVKNKSIKVFNYGDMKRDFTYIDDIIQGINNIINDTDKKISRPLYKIYNIGNSSPVQLTDFISAIEENLGMIAVKELLPMQPGDVSSTWADVSELEKDFNYRPNTDIKKGVKNFVDWYKTYYKIV